MSTRFFACTAVSATTALLCAVSTQFIVAAAAAAPCSEDPTLKANKAVVLSALDGIFNQRDPTAVDRYIGKTYLQHNPGVADGPEQLKNFIPLLPNGTNYEVGTQAAEGELVWCHSRSGGVGAGAGIVVDVFRVVNGKMVEHWDIGQDEVPANQTPSRRPMFPITSSSPVPIVKQGCGDVGAIACAFKESLKANKALTAAALDAFFNKKDASAVDKYIGAEYLQHNPFAKDSPQQLKSLIGSLPATVTFELGAQVASDDLVWTQGRYSGVPGQNTSITIDIFRVKDGKIVEHWDVVQQEVPVNQTVSGRPMFPIKP